MPVKDGDLLDQIIFWVHYDLPLVNLQHFFWKLGSLAQIHHNIPEFLRSKLMAHSLATGKLE